MLTNEVPWTDALEARVTAFLEGSSVEVMFGLYSEPLWLPAAVMLPHGWDAANPDASAALHALAHFVESASDARRVTQSLWGLPSRAHWYHGEEVDPWKPSPQPRPTSTLCEVRTLVYQEQVHRLFEVPFEVRWEVLLRLPDRWVVPGKTDALRVQWMRRKFEALRVALENDGLTTVQQRLWRVRSALRLHFKRQARRGVR